MIFLRSPKITKYLISPSVDDFFEVDRVLSELSKKMNFPMVFKFTGFLNKKEGCNTIDQNLKKN